MELKRGREPIEKISVFDSFSILVYSENIRKLKKGQKTIEKMIYLLTFGYTEKS